MSTFDVVTVFVLLLVFAYIVRPRPVPVMIGTVEAAPQVQEPEPEKSMYGNPECKMDLVGCNCLTDHQQQIPIPQHERPLATVTQISDAPSLRPAT